MRIERLTAHDFKIFSKLDLELNGKSTVLFGVNGTGKSTALEIISYLFRVWVNRINPSQGRAYESLSDSDVRLNESACEIEADVTLGNNHHHLSRSYHRKKLGMQKRQVTYDRKEYEWFCEDFVSQYLESQVRNMPIFVNYGTNRSVLDIPLRIRNKHEFDITSALERAIENELDFRTFFEWFRNLEDLENEVKLETNNPQYEDVMLKCVRTAVENMLGNVRDLRVRRNPLSMKVTKNGEEISVDQLSDGEKCTLALFGDLARRIALANQYLANPLEGKGVVMIDEIELHMHPSWQRRVLGVLKDTFPNIQFIVTTHSPQILGEADENYNIFLFRSEGNECVVDKVKRMDGLDSNFILEEYMETTSKNEKVKALIREINSLIRQKKYSEAEKELELLREISGNNDEDVILAEGFLLKSRMKNDIH